MNILQRLQGKKTRDFHAKKGFHKLKKDPTCGFLSRFNCVRGSSSEALVLPNPAFRFAADSEDPSTDPELATFRGPPRVQRSSRPLLHFLSDSEELSNSDALLLPRVQLHPTFSPSRSADGTIQTSLPLPSISSAANGELELPSIICPSVYISTAARTSAAFQFQLEDNALLQNDEMGVNFANENLTLMQNGEIRQTPAQNHNPMQNAGMMEVGMVDSAPVLLGPGLIDSAPPRPPLLPYESVAFKSMLEKIKTGVCTAQSFGNVFLFMRGARPHDIPRLEKLFGHALKCLLTSQFYNEDFKTSEPYRVGFCAMVCLLHNSAVLDLAMQHELLEVVDWMLGSGSTKIKENAVTLILEVSSHDRDKFNTNLGNLAQSIMGGLVGVLSERPGLNLLRLALKTLLSLCLSPQNRALAVEAGAVATLVTILPSENAPDFISAVANVENCIAILELLSMTPQGIQSMRDQETFAFGVTNVILRISERVTESAIDILFNICAAPADERLRTQERVVQAGARNRLLLVLQGDGTRRSKQKAQQLLKILLRYWLQESSTVHDTDHTCIKLLKI